MYIFEYEKKYSFALEFMTYWRENFLVLWEETHLKFNPVVVNVFLHKKEAFYCSSTLSVCRSVLFYLQVL